MSGDESVPDNLLEVPKVDDGTKYLQAGIELSRQKRASKRDTIKIRHHIEKILSTPSTAKEEIEHRVEQLWTSMEETQGVMDELSAHYLGQKDYDSQKAMMAESNELESDCNKVIEKAQIVIIAKYSENTTVEDPAVGHDNKNTNVNSTNQVTGSQDSSNPNNVVDVTVEQNPPGVNVNIGVSPGQEPGDSGLTGIAQSTEALNTSAISFVTSQQPTTIPPNSAATLGPTINHRLKQVKVPTFDGDKTKFEEYWGLFESLVDLSTEPTSIKMARLRQSLTGRPLECIRGLGTSAPEYAEAKEILKSKFGGQRRQLRAYLDELERMPPLRNSDVRGFEKLADLVRVTVVKLQVDGKQGELGDGTLHSLLVKKLTERQLESYTRWMTEHDKERSVISLRDWLKEEVLIRVEAVEMAHGVEADGEEKHSQRTTKPYGKEKPRSFFSQSGNQRRSKQEVENEAKRKPPCNFCGGLFHGIWKCRRFEQETVEVRWNYAKENQLCFRCLSKDHRGKDCRRSQPCGVDGCKLNHHRLLHRRTMVPPLSPPNSDPPVGPPREGAGPPWEGAHQGDRITATTQNPMVTGECCSLRTVPVWLKANGRKVKVNAIMDDASNETFLHEDVASQLGITGVFQKVQVHVLNSKVETFQSMPIKVDIESVAGDFRKTIEVKTCPDRVTGTYKVEDWGKKKEQWPHLNRCDFPKPAMNSQVDLLIGVDNADLHYSMADVRGPNGGPIARLGPLGWTCIGRSGTHDANGNRSHIVHSFLAMKPQNVSASPDCCNVNDTLRKFWEVENYGTDIQRAQIMTKEEKSALDKVEASLTHTGTRYRLSVPWKEERPELPSNRQMALKRLESTERNLNGKNSFVKNEYQNTINAYVDKGYLRKLSPKERPVPSAWYLPHFPIVKMEKSTSKVRIVFDCSAKCDGISLNDTIHAGPKLQTELFDVLVRFRKNPVGIACDIKEMFLQIEIEEKDRPYFRILWRDYESEREPDEYEFTRVVFGKNSAPMESQLVAQENARRHQDRYPLAAETVLKSTYMDDSIDSIEDDAKAVKLSRELQDLWQIAGMQARKWVSNSEQVLASIPEEYRASELVIPSNDEQPVTKALGILWRSNEDTLAVSTPSVPASIPITKRNVLKGIATLFDPLGLVSPVVVRGKILLQVLWARGYDWDDVIQDETSNEIRAWFDQLSDICRAKIPRCIRDKFTVVSLKLITFVDASTKAFGAAVYARVEYEQPHPTTCRLLASKSKVAPLTPVTVPRLELMAAVIGLRLTQALIRVLEIPMNMVTFFSDSLDVLWWIRGHGKDFRAFVANRVGEIQMFTDPQQWQHVPTDQNPADLVSRGVSAKEIESDNLWWSGPEWLLKDQCCWPRVEDRIPAEMKECKRTTVLASRFNPVDRDVDSKEVANVSRLSVSRFSSWLRLVRLYAWVIRFVDNMRRDKDERTIGELQPTEIADAEEEIIRQAQFEAFPEEYKALKKKKPISQKSPLVKLSPRLDDNGIIRLEGRLMYAEYLPHDMKFPIILPRGHHVTKLIVKYYHEMANHSAGTNFILSQMSQKFWIIAAREEIRSWEQECNECKKRKKRLGSQVMAPLPQVRLRFTFRPFDQCAVDYAGPFITIQGRGKARQKRYLCLFTCLATRAIHLEMAWSLETESFLNAFTRFTSRRGVPTEVTSDNGTNFVGAVNELRDLVGKLDQDEIQRKTVHMFNKVRWHFNPPAGPHFGGIHEVMIKCAKHAIYAVLGNGDIWDEELLTAFTGAESLLNSRPLTYQSADVRDATPLTPNHFLHGQIGGEVAPEAVDFTSFNLRNRWRRVQQLLSQVWSRWMKEYLPTLNKRPKWTEIVKSMKEGDIVLVLDPQLPRGRWPLGRIVQTFPGKDGHTRVAKVQCGGKTLVRPIHKLVPLLAED